MSARYILQQIEKGQFRFNLTTHSGQVLLTSRVYTDKDSALRNISATRQLAHNEKNYELLVAENGQSYFIVRNARGEVLGQSEMYPDPASMRTAINRVKGNTRGARLEDLTKDLV
jgi:uncharacterized protein